MQIKRKLQQLNGNRDVSYRVLKKCQHGEESRDMQSSLCFVQVTKSKRVILTGHVEGTGEKRNVYRGFFRNL